MVAVGPDRVHMVSLSVYPRGGGRTSPVYLRTVEYRQGGRVPHITMQQCSVVQLPDDPNELEIAEVLRLAAERLRIDF